MLDQDWAAECGHGCASQETTVLCHLTMPGLEGDEWQADRSTRGMGMPRLATASADGQITPAVACRIGQASNNGITMVLPEQ